MRVTSLLLTACALGMACTVESAPPPKDHGAHPADTDSVDNTTPIAIHIEPVVPRFDDDLRCVIDSAPAGVAIVIQWTVDGQAYSGPTSHEFHAGDRVDDLQQAGFQEWTCTATVGAGPATHLVTSAPVTIRPPVPMVRIEPGTIHYATLHDREYRTYRLTRAFAFSTTEVTQEAYRAVLEEPPMPLAGERMPVQRLTFHQAARFENALSVADGLPVCYPCVTVGATTTCVRPADLYGCLGYRMPSETEWAFVASERGAHPDDMLPAGGNFVAPPCDGIPSTCYEQFGYYPDMPATGGNAPPDSTVGDQCVYVANAAEATGAFGPNPVGTKRPTLQGVFDLCGNVNEWVADAYPPSTPQATDDPYVSEGGSGLKHVSDYQGTRSALDVKTESEAVDDRNTAGIRVTRTLTTVVP